MDWTQFDDEKFGLQNIHSIHFQPRIGFEPRRLGILFLSAIQVQDPAAGRDFVSPSLQTGI